MLGVGLIMLALVLMVLAVVCFVGAVMALVALRPLIAIALFIGAAILVVLAILTGPYGFSADRQETFSTNLPPFFFSGVFLCFSERPA